MIFYKNIAVKPSTGAGIRPDIRPLPGIRYPAFGVAGYPAKTVSGASLLIFVGYR
jgi:hypothetical protein